PESLLNPNVVWITGEFTLENIKYAIERIQFFDAALLSLQNTVFGTLASLISCSLVGYGFARYEYAEKKIAFLLVIITIIIPPQTMLITQFLQYKSFDFGGILGLFGVELNLLSTSWVFVLPALFACGLRNGLFIFIFRQFFLGLPKDLEEAAWVDGCNPLKTFIRIIIPSAGNGLVTVSLFSFVWHWNDYYFSEMLYNTELKPLIPMMYVARAKLSASMNAGGEEALNTRGILSAAGLLTIIVPMVLYLALQRHFVESIERTGIVG
ncbi:MAG: carbohydrate ABC transporter permease, partial [Clostridia bacterium]|nr:carbohydrate ABC transporter permease [Clostridia bacterium]